MPCTSRPARRLRCDENSGLTAQLTAEQQTLQVAARQRAGCGLYPRDAHVEALDQLQAELDAAAQIEQDAAAVRSV